MEKSDKITVSEAAQWLARMAAVDGAVSANGMALLKEFADTFGIDIATAENMVVENNPAPAELPLPEIDEEAVYAPKRIVRPMSELKQVLEEEEAKKKEKRWMLRINMPGAVPFLTPYMAKH